MKPTLISLRRLSPLLLAVVAVPALSAQAAFKFNGSSTTHKMLLPHVAEVAAAHAATVAFVPNGTGHGVEDLAAGKADVAMVTGNIEYFARLLNEKKPGTIDVAKTRTFRLADLSTTAATAIVHPSNPVKSLTHEQLRGLFTGRIANWKEVGGPDLPVVVVVPDPYDGVWASFTVAILQNSPVAASARKVILATDLPRVVAQLPGAVAFLSIANAVGDVRKVAPAPEFIPPNYLVTLGEPSDALKAVITGFVSRVK